MASVNLWCNYSCQIKNIAYMTSCKGYSLMRNPCRTVFKTTDTKRKEKRYKGRKLVGYSMDEMYSVVSDVGKYKHFIPFCKKSDILAKSEGFLKADLAIGFPPIQERYTSNVLMRKPHLVEAVCTDGKLFDHLTTIWRFSPGLKSNTKTCIIDFTVSFQFKSVFHSQIAHLFFDQLVVQMEGAFITEAGRRFGKASTRSVKLSIADV